MIEEPQELPERDEPNVAVIAMLGLMAGLLLWLGGACLVFGDGGDGPSSPLGPRTVSTAQQEAARTPTPPRFRTNCAEIRGTEYRSDAERTWFLQNCS